MSTISNKRNTVIKFVATLFAFAYGLYIAESLQGLYTNNSGDINEYIDFFEDYSKDVSVVWGIGTANGIASIHGDTIFRVGVIFFSNYLNIEVLSFITLVSFIMSALVFRAYSVSVLSRKNIIYLLPLLLCVFFTPNVSNLFASAIRSGIAFTILMLSMIYLRGYKLYIFFLLSSLIHLSMIPIIFFYFLFYTIRKLQIKSPFIAPFFLLILISFSITLASFMLNFNVTPTNSSIYFKIFTLYLGLLLIFTNRKAIQNIYGFMSVGLILVYLSGLIIDISFLRYVGNALVLYLLFLIKKGGVGTVQVFTIGYIPFFLLTSFYSIANI